MTDVDRGEFHERLAELFEPILAAVVSTYEPPCHPEQPFDVFCGRYETRIFERANDWRPDLNTRFERYFRPNTHAGNTYQTLEDRVPAGAYPEFVEILAEAEGRLFEGLARAIAREKHNFKLSPEAIDALVRATDRGWFASRFSCGTLSRGQAIEVVGQILDDAARSGVQVCAHSMADEVVGFDPDGFDLFLRIDQSDIATDLAGLLPRGVLGYTSVNGFRWPGPVLQSTEGDQVEVSPTTRVWLRAERKSYALSEAKKSGFALEAGGGMQNAAGCPMERVQPSTSISGIGLMMGLLVKTVDQVRQDLGLPSLARPAAGIVSDARTL